MGNALARYRSRKNRRVLLVGLDAAGKTTLLFRLYAGKTLNTIPTVGFNMKTVRIQGLNMNIWDVGGQDQLREFWRHHFTGTQGVVFVVDAADQDRLTDAKAEFEKVVTDEQLANAAVLILANKQDTPNATPPAELERIFNVKEVCRDRKWHVQPTTLTSGDGVEEAFAWLADNMVAL